MKFLDATGLEHLLKQIQARLKIIETKYTYVTSDAEVVSFTVPNLTTNDSLEVLVNNLVLFEGTDYTLTGAVVTLTKELDAGQTCQFVVRSVTI